MAKKRVIIPMKQEDLSGTWYSYLVFRGRPKKGKYKAKEVVIGDKAYGPFNISASSLSLGAIAKGMKRGKKRKK